MKANFIKRVLQAVTLDRKHNVYHYADPLYPQTTNYLIENSISAKLGADMLLSYIIGSGFGEFDTISISDELYLSDFGRKVAQSLSRNRGVFIHINYNFLNGIKHESYDVLPFDHCRLGKKDDNKYNGKIAVCSDWTTGKSVELFDVYNPREIVIREQAKQKGWKGQVYYFNLDYNSFYPNSIIHSVINDCKSEINAGIYKSASLEGGFFGKTLLVTRPFVSETDTGEILLQKTSERDKFKKTLESFIGAENNTGILHMEMEFDNVDDIEKQMIFKDIQSNIDDKLFAYTEESVAKNIIKTFYNIPPLLVFQNDGVFGNSGESIIQAQKQYWNNTKHIRETFEIILNELFKNHKNYAGTPIKVLPLLNEQSVQ